MKKRKSFFREDKPFIYEKIKEFFSSVLPIIFIVLILSFTIAPIISGVFLAFICGAFMVVVGIGFFTLWYSFDKGGYDDGWVCVSGGYI